MFRQQHEEEDDLLDDSGYDVSSPDEEAVEVGAHEGNHGTGENSKFLRMPTFTHSVSKRMSRSFSQTQNENSY